MDVAEVRVPPPVDVSDGVNDLPIPAGNTGVRTRNPGDSRVDGVN